jgi:hypothetical protein
MMAEKTISTLTYTSRIADSKKRIFRNGFLYLQNTP